MAYYKKYDNGLRLIIEKMDGLFSVSAGVMIYTGSANETANENGISHFIEHVMFKGTSKRTAFQISDYIDRLGAQINAFTSKEITCYYTKSTFEHSGECLEVLSDIFFNSTFLEEELEKEKGVIIEEINMSEDSPEDLLFDLLSESYFGNSGLGQTILGPAKNIKRFSKKDVLAYMDKYYTADNIVISIAGNVDIEKTEKLVEELFVKNFSKTKSKAQVLTEPKTSQNLYKHKSLEQSHIGLCMPAFSVDDKRTDSLSIANIVLGGGMSSRLFQKIREELGLAYSVYSYASTYKNQGILEIYAGVSPDKRNLAFDKIIQEINTLKQNSITEQEFLRAKEQIKSSMIMGRESTASQMILYGKYLLFLNQKFDFEERLQTINNITIQDVEQAISSAFDLSKVSTATIGPVKSPIKYKV